MAGRKYKLGLALGGGGARGWAHLGVLRALRENGIEAEVVSGTSMGAVVGAAYAASQLPELEKVALNLDWKHSLYYFMEMGLPRSGMVDGAKIEKALDELMESRQIEDLDRPFTAVATDLNSGRAVLLDRGEVIPAVRASISVPALFTPVTLDGRLLVDGGLVNPLPVDAARRMGCDVVLASEINIKALEAGLLEAREEEPAAPEHPPEDAGSLLERFNQALKDRQTPMFQSVRRVLDRNSEQPNIFDVMGQTLRIFAAEMTKIRLESAPPDLLLQPDVGNIRFMEFHRVRECVQAGHEAMTASMGELRDLLDGKKPKTGKGFSRLKRGLFTKMDERA